MSYSAFKALSEALNNKTVEAITKSSKDKFCSNELQITIALGVAGEIYEIISTIDEEIYMLNKELYSLIEPIKTYFGNLLNNYKLANSYKLYDSFKIDLTNLKNFLNKVIK